MRSDYDLNLCGFLEVSTQKHIYTVLAKPETDQSDLFIVRLFLFSCVFKVLYERWCYSLPIRCMAVVFTGILTAKIKSNDYYHNQAPLSTFYCFHTLSINLHCNCLMFLDV